MNGSGPHLASEQLASVAVRVRGDESAGSEDVRDHLARCDACFAELVLAVAALDGARHGARRLEWLHSLEIGPFERPLLSRVAWVAAMILLFVGLAILWQPTGMPPAERRISGDRLSGESTIEAREQIVVDSTAIGSGAKVILRSGRLVAFGEGFAVHSSASLDVQLQRGGGS